MTAWLYLIGLTVSIFCLLAIDRRYKLAFWKDRTRTIITVLVAMTLFVIWDMLGIALGIFFDGSSQYMLPVRLLPHFPIEELFFLFLLSYVTLLIYNGASRRWSHM